MNVVLTGANGYIGRALAKRLCEPGTTLHGRTIDHLTLCDLKLESPPRDARIECVAGSIADADVIRAVTASRPEVVFHLASVPSGQSETNYALGLAVNVHATIALIETLRLQGHAPIVVFTSSIAVFGSPLPSAIDDATPLRPSLSYGAHKQMMEIFLADCTRRDFVDARSVRLPGIVARPPTPTGALSAFSSELIRALANRQPYTCPVSPEATLWLMSLPCCVYNLMHAAQPGTDPAGSHAWTLPALRVRIAEIVEAFDRKAPGAGARVRYEPIESLEAQFGRLPPLSTPAAQAAGFRHDGDVPTLLRRAASAQST